MFADSYTVLAGDIDVTAHSIQGLRGVWSGLRDSGHEFWFQCRMHLTQALALQHAR